MTPLSVRPWTLGRFQALAFAKTWSGKALLPSTEKMWSEYPGPKRSLFKGGFGELGEEGTPNYEPFMLINHN